MGCIFGCGIGQAFSLCGNLGANFAACYSCHARERMRRKWNLPPAFGLPPGIDDCLVHFFCAYCASHQVGGGVGAALLSVILKKRQIAGFTCTASYPSTCCDSGLHGESGSPHCAQTG